jgi:hypothetical protein
MSAEPSVIAHVHGLISQQLLCIDPRRYTAIFHLLLRHEMLRVGEHPQQ